MNLIVAVSENWGIGKGGQLLFSLPGDMKYFREKTQGKVVIMGRETLDSMPGGRPLKNRVNIVVTRNKAFNREGAIVRFDIESVLQEAAKYPPEEVFVIGGQSVYERLLSECDTAYITRVDALAEADRFFPNLDVHPDWELSQQSEQQEENGLTYRFCIYRRKNLR